MNHSHAMNQVPPATRPKVPREALYQTPPVAPPTLLLFVLGALLWGAGLWGGLSGQIPVPLTVLMQTVAAFMQFTVLHDGVHRSLARGYPFLNTALSSIAGASLGLLAASAAFRHVHFKHHRHTNEPSSDPDLWSGHGRPWLLPLRWATADLYYGYVILKDWAEIPARERLQIAVGTSAMALLFVALVVAGFGREALLFWMLPARLAIVWLAFAFNFLPHHPHMVEQRHNPYAATSAREGGEPVMRWLFLFQNYHIVHHLYPSVPFYRYLKIWRLNQKEFCRQGTPVVAWHAVNPR